jgi:hypothetical protein
MLTKEFKKLLENEILTDGVKNDLKEAVEKYKDQLVETTTKDLEVEYAKKLQKQKEDITTNLTNMVSESVKKELKELSQDLSYYKDLEITYATKLEEFKKEYSEKLEESFSNLVKTHVDTELEELREDLKETKELGLGKRIFEAYKSEFAEYGLSPDVKALKADLDKTKKELESTKNTISENVRNKVMENTLKSLSGNNREIMKTILENVETDKIEDRYNETIDSVLENKDSNKKKSTKYETVLETVDDEYNRIRSLANIGQK